MYNVNCHQRNDEAMIRSDNSWTSLRYSRKDGSYTWQTYMCRLVRVYSEHLGHSSRWWEATRAAYTFLQLFSYTSRRQKQNVGSESFLSQVSKCTFTVFLAESQTSGPMSYPLYFRCFTVKMVKCKNKNTKDNTLQRDLQQVASPNTATRCH